MLTFDYQPEISSEESKAPQAYVHHVVPHCLNQTYLQTLFMQDSYLKDPLKHFVQNYNAKRLQAGGSAVRQRKVRV